ncbi:MAG TPA: CDP-alcohol phosphatidyltransferase family protein [Rhizomicrobium sp.]|jgi:phosphatidylglycerophosphate synthase
MLDQPLRTLATPVAQRGAAFLAGRGAGADMVSVIGFFVGLAAIPTIATHHYWAALGLIVLNRLVDALDGAVARQSRASGRGAFLDMILDLIVFAGLPFGFALADPSRALAASFFIFAIAASQASAVFFNALASREGSQGVVIFGYVGRLMEDSELTLAFVIACLMPQWFSLIAYIAGVLCFLTAGSRIAMAVARFSSV